MKIFNKIKKHKYKLFILISTLIIGFGLFFTIYEPPKPPKPPIKPRILSTEKYLTKKEKEFILNEFKKVEHKKYEYYMVFVVNKDFSLKKVICRTDKHPTQVYAPNINEIIEKLENENKEKVLLIHNHHPSIFGLVPSEADDRIAEKHEKILQQKWPNINVFSIVVCVDTEEKCFQNFRKVLYPGVYTDKYIWL